MRKGNFLKGLFQIVYVFGILAGGVLIFGIYLGLEGYISIGKSNWMLGAPIIFIFLLFLIALSNGGLKNSGEIAGNKIQSAGYLYTLIGVVIAMIQIDGDSYTVNDAIKPIGAALLTSLAGWFFGSFIEGEDSPSILSKEAKEAADALKATKLVMATLTKVTTEYETFMKRIGEAHNAYILSVKAGVSEFEEIKQKASEIKEGMEGMKKLAGFLASKDLQEYAKAMPEAMKSLHDHLKAVEVDAKEYVAGLKQLDTMREEHIEMLKKLADNIEHLRT